jgi:hypothetical protein
MIWMDYLIESGNNKFTVKGDWPGEVMGKNKDGTWGGKSHPLYQPGDVFVVDEDGWLVKQEDSQ